jgi:BirA family transcriptional regulator, biotin operon repressor / biotin---[acetyl-CoA-carboxylase] ligase
MNCYIGETQSTNILLWKMFHEKSLPEGFVLYTDFQTAGKGQYGNFWESERGKNLLFSMILYPTEITFDQLFILSQLVCLAIKTVLEKYTDGITVKWPNDIYWNDKKIAGILIENSLQGNKVKAVVIGIGLNVNQKEFVSNAPNPISMKQIIGKSLNRNYLLKMISKNILKLYTDLDLEKIRQHYTESLYRIIGFHEFKSGHDVFLAKIKEIKPDGQLILEKENGEQKYFYFKEVQFIN